MAVYGDWQPAVVEPNAPAGARAWPAQIIRNAGTLGFDVGLGPRDGNPLYTDGSSHSALWTEWPTTSAIGSDLDFEVGGPDYGKRLRAARNRALETPGSFVDEVQALRALSTALSHPALDSMPPGAVGVEFDGGSPVGAISSGTVHITLAQQVYSDAGITPAPPPAAYGFEVRAGAGDFVATELTTSPTRFHYGFVSEPSLGGWAVAIDADVDTAGVVSASTSQITWSDPAEALNLWVVPTSTSSDPAHDAWMWRPEIVSMEFTATVTWPAYRYVFPGGGAWRARQRQALVGNTGGWPARQRQNGADTGAWSHRQRQAGA